MIINMALSESLEEQITIGMFDRGLLGFPADGVRLKSGRISPYYYNDRPSLSFSRELDQSGRMLIAQQREFRESLVRGFAACFLELGTHIDHIFGKAQAATAPAAVGAFQAGLSYLWERIDEPGKTHGAHQRVEGDYGAGEQVGLADDVVTDGRSKIEGAQILRDVGLIPVAATIKFDREEGGMQTLEEHDFEVNAVVGLSRAVKYLVANGRIGSSEVDSLAAYHASLREAGLPTTYSPRA
jgi:orotate phosphoribosyltransferase